MRIMNTSVSGVRTTADLYPTDGREQLEYMSPPG